MLRPRLLFLTLAIAIAASAPAGAQSRRGEMRGAWLGSGSDRDWQSIMRSLKDNGFNALFANFSTGDTAYYPSKVLSVRGGGRNELAEAARAARENGIELHVWRIDWALWDVTGEAARDLEAAGRLQRRADGTLGRDDPNVKCDWLCPSNPANRKIEKDAMVELVRDYDIAGVQLDYMRFPNGDHCFCDHCKAQFEKDTRIQVQHWPADVQDGGAHSERWQAWRRESITSLAREISAECHRVKPSVFVSLAAWPNLHAAQEDVAQDWVGWVEEGMLDFVCPMDYTESRDRLVTGYLRPQLDRVGGAIPFYAGLGGFRMDSSAQLIEQIQATRDLGADGFVVFSLGDKLSGWLADLRATVTSTDPNPMPHWAPPTEISFGGPATASPASERNVIAGAQLEVGLAVGLPPDVTGYESQSEGAAQAASILRRASDSRSPVTSYEPPPTSVGSFGDEPARVSARVVAETPAGLSLAVLAAFDGGLGVRRTYRLSAPEGPFRIAIYGDVTRGADKPRAFVARSVLLEGKPPEARPDPADKQAQPEPAKAEAELARLLDGICARLTAASIGDISGALQLQATGAGGGMWWYRLDGGTCTMGQGKIENPDVTTSASAADLRALLRGEADPYALVQAGRLTVVGNPVLVARIAAALGYGAD